MPTWTSARSRATSALLLAGLAGLATNLVFLLSLLLFISIETSGADARLAVMIADRPLLGAALGRFTRACVATWS